MLTIKQINTNWPLGWQSNTQIMGIINLTPDSFSDGGDYVNKIKAIDKAQEFINAGVGVIDIGGQSTRPGAQLISAEEEINRIAPAVKAIRTCYPKTILSIDTFHSKVAQFALDIGVNWVNDISGGRLDPNILKVVSNYKVPFVITHSRGNSKNMNSLNQYENIVEDVYKELMLCVDKAVNIGICKDRIIIDPGLGFAKDSNQNLLLLNNLEKFTNTDFPVLIGPSRKKFIGDILEEVNPKKRIFGTAAVACRCVQARADIIRVHDVAEISQTINMAESLWPR